MSSIVQQNNEIIQTTPDKLLALAINKDLDIIKLKELMVMHKEWKDSIAREAFISALVEFQSECPELRKNKIVQFKTNSGHTEYRYAPLADIDRQIKKPLKDSGLSKRWEIKDEGEKLVVTCIITHKDGHSEKTTMSANADKSGGKNEIQARGSAIEYLKRYTLIGALGITTADTDTDGQLPQIDIDILHKQYMEHYNQLIAIDQKYSKWHPDNWKSEPTAKLYVKAIGEIRKELVKVTPKEI